MIGLFPLSENPFYRREIRGRFGWLWLVLCGLVLLAAYVPLGVFLVWPELRDLGAFWSYFSLVVSGATGLILFLVPGLVAECVTSEKEARRLELLVLSPYPMGRMLAGKLAARLRGPGALILGLLPALFVSALLFHSPVVEGFQEASRVFMPGALPSRPDPPPGALEIEGYTPAARGEELSRTRGEVLFGACVLGAAMQLFGLFLLAVGIAVFTSCAVRTSTAALTIAYGAMLPLPCLLCGCVSYLPAALFSMLVFGMPDPSGNLMAPVIGTYSSMFLGNGIVDGLIGGGLLYASVRWFEPLCIGRG